MKAVDFASYQADREPRYSVRQMREMLDAEAQRWLVNRVVLRRQDYEIALQIVDIVTTPEGSIIYVA